MANALVKLALAASVISSNSDAMAQTGQKMEKKILFVVTSHDTKGSTGEPTGYYLGEVSHPWEVLSDAGYEVDFVSPKGGKALLARFQEFLVPFVELRFVDLVFAAQLGDRNLRT